MRAAAAFALHLPFFPPHAARSEDTHELRRAVRNGGRHDAQQAQRGAAAREQHRQREQRRQAREAAARGLVHERVRGQRRRDGEARRRRHRRRRRRGRGRVRGHDLGWAKGSGHLQRYASSSRTGVTKKCQKFRSRRAGFRSLRELPRTSSTHFGDDGGVCVRVPLLGLTTHYLVNCCQPHSSRVFHQDHQHCTNQEPPPTPEVSFSRAARSCSRRVPPARASPACHPPAPLRARLKRPRSAPPPSLHTHLCPLPG